ncbi:putative ribonuclease H-like domain-containing protein [Tanacetum coccineum]
MEPRAVLMKSGLVSVNTVSQVNAAHSKTIVNAARPISYLSKTTHSTGNPQMDLQDQGVIDSGCSRHMTGNIIHIDAKGFAAMRLLEEEVGMNEFVNEPVVENCKAMSSEEEPKVVRKNNDAPIIEEWVSDDEEEDVSQPKTEKKTVRPSIVKKEFVKSKQQEKSTRKTVKQVEQHRQNTHSPRGNQRNWNNMMSQKLGSNFEMFNKACYVCGSFDHLQNDCNYHQKQFQNHRMVKPVWNDSQRVNHQNFAKKTHPCAKKNMVPRAVLMKSGLVSVNTARQVNAAHSKTTVNAARPMSYLSKTTHSTVKRPIHKNTTFKNSNINQKVNTVRGKNLNTAKPKAVVNAVKGNNLNAVKASACWVWKPKHKVLDHGNPQMDLQDQGVIDSGCSRHMTGNMSYLTNYEEIDGGYVAFGGNPKGGKIIRKCTIKTGSVRQTNVTADPPFSQDPKSSHDDGSKASSDDEKKVDEVPRKDSKCKDQEKQNNVNSTNNVNAVSINKVNVVGGKTSIELPVDPNMLALEDYSIFDLSIDDEDDGAEAYMNKLDTTIQVSPIPTTRIHKDHPLNQVIGLQSATQTRKMSKNLKEHGTQKGNSCIEGSNLDRDYAGRASTIQVTRSLNFSGFTKWKKGYRHKWVFKNKKDKRGIVIRNKARLVAQGYTQEKGIDYDEVFAPIARIEAIRLFLAYASFKDFVVYQMDVKSAFSIGRLKKRCMYVNHQDLKIQTFLIEYTRLKRHYIDYIKHLELGMKLCQHICWKIGFKEGKLTRPYSSKGTKCNSIRCIFISQDKYVDEILKKFGFTKVKTASTPMETQKPLLKDEDVCACAYARSHVNPKVSSSCVKGFLGTKRSTKIGTWYLKDSSFDLVAYTDSDYAGASLDRKSTTRGYQFFGCRLISWQCKKQKVAKTINGEVQLHALVDGKKINITKSTVRRDLQLKDVEDIVADKAIPKELGDSLVRAATTTSSLKVEQDSGATRILGIQIAQTRFENVLNIPMIITRARSKGFLDLEETRPLNSIEFDRLKRRSQKLKRKGASVKEKTHGLKRLHKVGMSRRVVSSGDEEDLGEDASKQGRRINAIDADEDITMVNVQDDAIFDIFDVEL